MCVYISPSLSLYHYQGSVPELCQRARFMEECNAHLPICTGSKYALRCTVEVGWVAYVANILLGMWHEIWGSRLNAAPAPQSLLRSSRT